MRLKITDALRRVADMSNWLQSSDGRHDAEPADHPAAARRVGVAIVGIAGVVIVLVSVLSIAQGFARCAGRGSPDARSSCAAAPTAR